MENFKVFFPSSWRVPVEEAEGSDTTDWWSKQKHLESAECGMSVSLTICLVVWWTHWDNHQTVVCSLHCSITEDLKWAGSEKAPRKFHITVTSHQKSVILLQIKHASTSASADPPPSCPKDRAGAQTLLNVAVRVQVLVGFCRIHRIHPNYQEHGSILCKPVLFSSTSCSSTPIQTYSHFYKRVRVLKGRPERKQKIH